MQPPVVAPYTRFVKTVDVSTPCLVHPLAILIDQRTAFSCRRIQTEGHDTAYLFHLCVRRSAVNIEIPLLGEGLPTTRCKAHVRPYQAAVSGSFVRRLVLQHLVLAVEAPVTNAAPNDKKKHGRQQRQTVGSSTALVCFTTLHGGKRKKLNRKKRPLTP